VGLYTELFFAIIPILFLYNLLICYSYILLHFQCFLPTGRARSAWPAGPKITLPFLHLNVRPHLSRAQ